MTYRATFVAFSLSLLATGCINGALDVGSLPSTGDGSGGDGATEDGDTTAGSNSNSDSESDTGEASFPDCEPPEVVLTYALPFDYADAFLGNRLISDCTVSSVALPLVSMDCVGEDGAFVAELSLEGLAAVPLSVDQTVVLDEVLETGPPQGYTGAGQQLSIRDAQSDALLIAGVDSGALNPNAEQFGARPWEPELELSVSAEPLCPVDDMGTDGLGEECGFDERVAIELTDGVEVVSVLDGSSTSGLGFDIYVGAAVDVHEPCTDAAGGDYQVLIVSAS